MLIFILQRNITGARRSPDPLPRTEPAAAQLSAAGASSGGVAAVMSFLNSSKQMVPDPSASQPMRSLDNSEYRADPSTWREEYGQQHTTSEHLRVKDTSSKGYEHAVGSEHRALSWHSHGTLIALSYMHMDICMQNHAGLTQARGRTCVISSSVIWPDPSASMPSKAALMYASSLKRSCPATVVRVSVRVRVSASVSVSVSISVSVSVSVRVRVSAPAPPPWPR